MKKLNICIVFLTVYIALGCSSGWAENGKNEVRAKSIYLVDDNDVERGGLIMQQGTPVIFLADQAKQLRAFMAIGSDGPNFALVGNDGKNKIVLSLNDSTGLKTIHLGENEKATQIAMFADGEGDSSIIVKQKNNESKLVLHAGASKAVLWTAHNNGKPNIYMGGGSTNGTILRFQDDSGKNEMILGASDSGALLDIRNTQDDGISFVAPNGSGPRMGIYKHGRPVWAPVGTITEEDIRIKDIISDIMR